jgi:hypothetical protein
MERSRHWSIRQDDVIPPVLGQAHRLVRAALERIPDPMQRFAIDTTVGNGFDTCYLARLVEGEQRVIGCDIQKAALDSTRSALVQEGLESRVTLMHCGHEQLHAQLDPSWQENVAAIMANLGYLPRGDKSIVTRPQTTLRMMETLLPWLRIHGVMTIVAYGGHSGGQEEVDAVQTFLSNLPQQVYRVLSYAFLNQVGIPPVLFAVERIR